MNRLQKPALALAIQFHGATIRDMEALKLKPVAMLAKCEPALPSGYEVASLADAICMVLVQEYRCRTLSPVPTVDDGWDQYLSETKLSVACYDPAGEFTAFGAKLYAMFCEAWAESLAVWKVEERDVD